jgi:hypothetical protein
MGATVDADADGLPDAWEKAFNATTPNGDIDGDGVSNLAEYQAGTDPRDPSSIAPLPPLALTSSLVTISQTGYFRLEWSAALGNPILETNTGLTGTWTQVVSGIQLNGQTFRYETPVSGSKAFFRLRRP